jgi:hypothetical protein
VRNLSLPAAHFRHQARPGFGGGSVELAIGLGVAPQRIDTIIDWPAAQEYGTKTAHRGENRQARAVLAPDGPPD